MLAASSAVAAPPQYAVYADLGHALTLGMNDDLVVLGAQTGFQAGGSNRGSFWQNGAWTDFGDYVDQNGAVRVPNVAHSIDAAGTVVGGIDHNNPSGDGFISSIHSPAMVSDLSSLFAPATPATQDSARSISHNGLWIGGWVGGFPSPHVFLHGTATGAVSILNNPFDDCFWYFGGVSDQGIFTATAPNGGGYCSPTAQIAVRANSLGVVVDELGDRLAGDQSSTLTSEVETDGTTYASIRKVGSVNYTGAVWRGNGAEIVLDGIPGLNLVAMSGNGTQHYTVGMVSNFSTAAVLWDEAGHAYRIDDLLAPGTNIRTYVGYFIANDGTILVWGQDEDANGVAYGDWKSYLLRPVPPADPGCTYTVGYWKTHPSEWPVSQLTVGGVTSSAPSLLVILNTPPRGNATVILKHQLIAAKLNLVDGADGSSIQATIDQADSCLSGATSCTRATLISLAEALTAFNEGTTGPGHCL